MLEKISEMYNRLWNLDEELRAKIEDYGDKMQVILPLAVLLGLFYCDYETHVYDGTICYIMCFAVGMGICSLLKAIFNNARPRNVEGSVNPKLDLEWTPTDGNSFPSGHTMSAMLGAWFAFEFGFFIGIVALVLAVGVAISRMIAKAHWLRDVSTSTILALGVYLMAIEYFI